MALFILIIGILFMGFMWSSIFYCLYMMNKYRKLANIERKKLEKLGIYVIEEPLM